MKKQDVKKLVVKALENHRRQKDIKSPGLHVVYSGMLDWLITQVGNKEDAIKTLDEMEKEQLIGKRPVKGGFMIYLYSDYVKLNNDSKTKKFEALLK